MGFGTILIRGLILERITIGCYSLFG